MSKEFTTLMVCITLVACSCIAGVTIYNINDRNNMAKNIESAIQKGIDPISVKCAYETNANAVCIAYSMGNKSWQQKKNKGSSPLSLTIW
jgi:hypothetical protein